MRKDKFIGFRLNWDSYLSAITTAQQRGVSVSDLMLSLLIPVISNNAPVIDVKQNVKHLSTTPPTDTMTLEALEDAKRRLRELNNE